LRLPIRPHKPEPNVVQFRAGKNNIAVTSSPFHQHVGVRQQRRRVSIASDVEAAGGTPRPAGRVVQFRVARIAALSPLLPAPRR
jgi:hypothetical protein